MFAIYEIKTAIITLLRKYAISTDHIPEINYFSPSAFGDMTDMKIKLKPILIRENNVLIQKVGDGYLIRNYLSKTEQVEYYNYMIDISKHAVEHVNILSEPTKRAYPICMWNNVYTGENNCDEPHKLIALGNKIISQFPDKINIKFINSVYGQLFGSDGRMAPHYDQYVDWGISINLGASVLFTFCKDTSENPNNVVLNSGDIFLGNFAKNLHSVEKIYDNAPDWFNTVPNYGRTRCSIQLRNNTNTNLITKNEFMQVLKVNN